MIKEVAYRGSASSNTLDGRIRIDEQKGLIAFDGSNNLGIFGFDSNNDLVLKIAEDGYDADTASDEHLLFNSKHRVFKILDTDTVALTQGSVPNPGAGNFGQGNLNLAVINHNLNFTPGVVAFIEFSTGAYSPLPYTAFDTAAGGTSATWQTYKPILSPSSLTIRCQVMVYGGSWNTFAPPVSVRYYLIQETAA